MPRPHSNSPVGHTDRATAPAATAPWLDLLDEVTAACERHGRPHLAAGLHRLRPRLADPALWVLVIGEPNQGKSQLVNALVNAPVCEVGDDVRTTVPTVVRHGATTASTSLGAVTEVSLPRRLLDGMVLVDAPPGQVPHEADVVVLATQAGGGLSRTELRLLREVAAWCHEIVVALTKTDLALDPSDAVARTTADLAAAGVTATVLPVSAALRLRAAGTGDQGLNAESGFAELVRRLRTAAVATPVGFVRRTAAPAMRSVVQRLAHELGGDAAGPVPDQRLFARCQTLVADDLADLAADLDFDLRDRARRILREVDTALDTADPSTQWDRFDTWLRAQLVAAADANFGWLLDRCRWTADRIARDLPVGATAPVPDRQETWVPPDAGPDRPVWDEFTVSQRAFTGLRGSYGGVLMLGLVTSLTVGLPLFNPISLGAGVLFGGRSISEESGTRLRRRQAAAKAAARRHVDDFFLRYGHDSRVVLRQVQRGLRDHIADLQRRATDQERHRRERHAELERLTALHTRLADPAAGTGASPAPVAHRPATAAPVQAIA